MRGGSVVIASSPFTVERGRASLSAKKIKSGLEDWLKTHGITQVEKMVLDRQHENYPVPISRKIGGLNIQEIQMLKYPYFVDVRGDGLNADLDITAGIPQITMNWPSPIEIDAELNKNRKVIELLHSSEGSWASDSSAVLPNFELYGEYGFPFQGEEKPFLLAAGVEGEFNSYFKGKDNPLLKAKEEEKEEEAAEDAANAEEEKENEQVFSGIIEKSSGSARIFLFSSNEFLSDQTLRISMAGGSTRFIHSLQLIENTMDWSSEDRGLLAIRSRGHFSNTLMPLERTQQLFWEYLNYALALLGLLIVFLIYKFNRTATRAQYPRFLQEGA